MWLITASIVSGRFFVIKISLQGLHFTFQNAWPEALKEKPERFSSLLSQVCPFPRDVLFSRCPSSACCVEIPWAQGWFIPPWLYRGVSISSKQAPGKHRSFPVCVCEQQPVLPCPGEPEEPRQSWWRAAAPSRGLLHKMPLLCNLFSPWLQPQCLKPKGWFVLCERITLSRWWVSFALSMSVPHNKRIPLSSLCWISHMNTLVVLSRAKAEPASHTSEFAFPLLPQNNSFNSSTAIRKSIFHSDTTVLAAALLKEHPWQPHLCLDKG